jgi:N-methylhydantoinase A
VTSDAVAVTTADAGCINLRVAFDIGGTFTDVIIAADAGQLFRYKILTLPNSIGADVRACIEAAMRESENAQVSAIVHGTTIAANAVLEHKGAKTGLITTAGFRDELEIRRLGRPGVYSVLWERSAPLIARRYRLEVPERLTVDGAVDTPLDEEAVRVAARRLAAAGIESLAISFLHSYANPAHEERALRIAQSELPGVPICISAHVLPEVREYERTSTTALNAYLMPVVSRYLEALETALAAYPAELRIMQSNGGVMSSRHTRTRPVNMIESGPAAGVLAAAALARELGMDRVVSFDMGGTTAKACLIEGGAPVETSEGEVGAGINLASRLNKGAGYALRVPAYDLAEVGAGGGSIAWVDEGGALRVGPHSAGAEPGPAAYGRGGAKATITDANILLGFMNPRAIAGGTVPIDRDAASAALGPINEALGLSEYECAYGVHQVGNATMARAIRAVTTERGRDPRDFDLIAFGGAGAIHALTLAQSLGIGRVTVPLHPGLFSALGLLMADLRYDFVQSVPGEVGVTPVVELRTAYAMLRERAISEASITPAMLAQVRFEMFVDLRYARQSSDLTLALPDVADTDLPGALADAFHAEHDRNYGYRRDGEDVAIVSIRLRATAPAKSFGFTELGATFAADLRHQQDLGAGSDRTRPAYFGPQHGVMSAHIVSRLELATQAQSGPFIVEEFDTTVVVPPGWHASVDQLGNIRLRSA